MTEETREEIVASLKTRNGIKVGDKVIYVGPSRLFPKQNLYAQAKLRSNVMYKCSWVYMGEDFEQIEVEEHPEDTWVHDMFMRVPRQ